jgi:ligand-binding sensor domain-containing protein
MQIKGLWTNYNSNNCPLPKEFFVSKLAAEANGKVCFAVEKMETYLENGIKVTEGKTDGILVFYQQRWRYHSLEELGVFETASLDLACDNDGQIWIYGSPKALYCFNGQSLDVYLAGKQGLPSDLGLVSVFTVDHIGNPWILCAPTGIYRFDGDTWRRVPVANNAKSEAIVSYLTVDPFGRIWSAIQDNQNTTFVLLENDQWHEYLEVSVGLEEANVESMVVDRNETLWVGWGDLGSKSDLGLWHVTGRESKWERYTVKNSPLFDNSIKSLTVDVKGRIWAGTTGGFSIFDGSEAVRWEIIIPGILQGPLTVEQAERDQAYNNSYDHVRISDYAVLDNEGHLWVRSHNGVSVFTEE